jgi:biopolymer transport protein ExbD
MAQPPQYYGPPPVSSGSGCRTLGIIALIVVILVVLLFVIFGATLIRQLSV